MNDTSSWEHFRISDLFDIKRSRHAIVAQDVEIFDAPFDGSHPYVVRQSGNNGRKGYIVSKESWLNDGDVLSFACDTAQIFYQNEPFFTGNNIKIFYLKDAFLTEELALFLVALLRKAFSEFRWGMSYKDEILSDVEILLPVTPQSTPDWDHMQEYIVKLEQEYIAELEQERIAELEQYLIATGLNDYTLTDEDLKILSSAAPRKDGECAGDAGVRREMREFRMGTIFEKKELKWRPNRTFDKSKDTSTVPTSEFSLPLVNAKHGDNGIMFYGRLDEWESTDMAIDIVSNGAIATGDVYPQPQNTGVLWDAYLIKMVGGTASAEVLMYLAGVIEKSIKLLYSYDNKAVWNKVRHDMIQLPIQTDPSNHPIIDPAHTYHPDGFVPDWDYMAAYIRAIEKLVIKDVVDFKDEFVAKTRGVVN